MNVLLYPYHQLRPYGDKTMPTSRRATIAAALLYFDTVTLGRMGYPEELDLWSEDEALAVIDRIKSRRGAHVVKRFWTTGDHSELTCDEFSSLYFIRYLCDEHTFRQAYRPLLQEGVLRCVSLAKETQRAKQAAEAAGHPDAECIDMRACLQGFQRTVDEFRDWPANDPDRRTFEEVFVEADTGLAAVYLRHALSDYAPDVWQDCSVTAKETFLAYSFLLDLHHQSALATVLGLPLASFHEAHIALRQRHVALFRSLQGEAKFTSGAETLALRALSKTMTSLPAIIPRSVEAILEVRGKLEAELTEFREAVSDVAADLAHGRQQEPTDEEIARAVQERFTKPLATLERRLARPGRDLARNLVTSGSLATGAVTLAATIISGGSAIAAALLGASVPLLVESLKTRFERQNDIEQSGVAFLVRAKKRR